MMSRPHIQSYRDFWPQYVRAHRRPMTRWLHFTGTTCALAAIGGAVVMSEPRLLLAAPVAGYGFAWVGHVAVERNSPETFRHPLWSLLGDLHMYGLMWTGRMTAEVRRLSNDTN